MDFLETAEFLSRIDRTAEAGETDRALQLALANFSAVGREGLLRERVAHTVAREGDEESGARIYRRLALHYANAGFPARSLATAKKAGRLGSEVEPIYGHFAALYNLRSPILDNSGRHRQFGGLDGELDTRAESIQIGGEQLRRAAIDRSLAEDGLADEPDAVPPLPLASRLPAESLQRLAEYVDLHTFDHVEEVAATDGRLVWAASPDLTLGDDDPTYHLPVGTLLGLDDFGSASGPSHPPAIARTGSEVLVLEPHAIDRLSDETQHVRSRLTTLHRHAFIHSLLERHPLFDDIPSGERRSLLERFRGVRVEEGEAIADTRGDSPGLYISVDARAELVRRGADAAVSIAEFEPGDVFGELGLVSDEARDAEIVASADGHVLFLPAREFRTIVAQYPAVAKFAVQLAKARRELLDRSAAPGDLEEVPE